MHVELPYVDRLLEGLRSGAPGVSTAFGRHMHWGYWAAPEDADGSAEDFAAAAERLTRRVCDAAGARDGQRVLDVGCGRGGTIASLDERFHDVDLVGLNIDPRQIELARRDVRPRPGNRVAFIEGDACRLPLADASFDVVLAVECVFHFADRARFLGEARRVLRPGGRLCLTDFVPAPPVAAALRLQDLLLGAYVRRVSGPTDIRCTLAGYRDLARRADLPLLAAEDVTAGTLPTYPVVRGLLREVGVHARAGVLGALALEGAARAGLLRYMVLSFERG